MKRIGLLLIVVLFLLGCGTAAERETFKNNPYHYRNYDHMKFSVSGYKKPSAKDANKSDSQKWWGEPVEVSEK